MAIRDNKEAYNAYHREYQLKRYHRIRQEAIKWLGGKCKICGSDQNLEIDHIDRNTKEIDLGTFWGSTKPYWKELKKCQILCEKCHKKKSDSEMIVHGSITRYRKGCRCDKCIVHKKERIAKPAQIHGTRYSYTRYKCRCHLCRAWNSQRMKDYKKSKQ